MRRKRQAKNRKGKKRKEKKGQIIDKRKVTSQETFLRRGYHRAHDHNTTLRMQNF